MNKELVTVKPHPTTKAWLLDGIASNEPCFQASCVQVREELISRNEHEAAMQSVIKERDELNIECQLSMQTIADERSRAEAVEARMAQLEAIIGAKTPTP